MPDLDVPNISLADKEDDTIEGPTGLYTVDCLHVSMYLYNYVYAHLYKFMYMYLCIYLCIYLFIYLTFIYPTIPYNQ